MSDVISRHRRACDGFSRAITAAAGHWDAPSPCSEWNASQVVEHVIGFHDTLLLRPLAAKPARPKGDVPARWALTVEALFDALARPGELDEQRRSLLGVLTTDVLIHTWDLSRAVGRDVTLDGDLCQIGYDRAVENQARLAASDMFGPPFPVPDDAPIQDRLLGVFGRDPGWMPPAR